jgi:hypothetical protein
MFTLRQFTTEGVQQNYHLGSKYDLILQAHSEKVFSEMKGKHDWDEQIYGFVYSPENGKMFVLSEMLGSFIMIDGKVIEDISKK